MTPTHGLIIQGTTFLPCSLAWTIQTRLLEYNCLTCIPEKSGYLHLNKTPLHLLNFWQNHNSKKQGCKDTSTMPLTSVRSGYSPGTVLRTTTFWIAFKNTAFLVRVQLENRFWLIVRSHTFRNLSIPAFIEFIYLLWLKPVQKERAQSYFKMCSL